MKPTTNQLIGAVVVLVIVAGGSFYAGEQHAGRGGVRPGMTMNMGAPGGPGAARGQFTTGSARGGMAGGLVAGSIVSKDADSITVSLAGGGSEVVYLSASTTVMKSDEGSADDLAAGQSVIVTGAKQSDGSVSASSVQIRPAGTMGAPTGTAR